MAGFNFDDAAATSERPADAAQIVPGENWIRGESDNIRTRLTPTWLNNLKANLTNLVTGLGGSLDDGDDMLINAVKNAVLPHSLLNQAGPPTATDDEANTSGRGVFARRSKWFDASNTELYECLNPAAGAAIWVKTSLTIDELGTAALKDFGTNANQLVELDSEGKLPGVDGSNLTGVPTSTANDSAFRIVNGSDVTKKMSFDLSGISPGSTRTVTMPDNDIDLGAIGSGGAITGESRLWNTETPPDGWLEEDGSAISRTTYADLFAVIGTSYGVGDGSTTFNLPDSRGRFVRIFDNGAGTDPDAASRTDRGDGTTGDNVGTLQEDAFQGHHHNLESTKNAFLSGGSSHWNMGVGSTTMGDFARDIVTDGVNGSPRVSSETRPINISKMMIIKY